MKKINTLVYPFDTHFLPLLRHNAYPQFMNFTQIVSPSGRGYSGKDVGSFDFGQELGMTVSDDFEAALAKCEAVFFTESDNTISKENIKLKINHAIDLEKHIFCTVPLTASDFNNLKEKSKTKKVEFEYYRNDLHSAGIESSEIESVLIDIDTPISMFFGLIEQVSKFDLQLAFMRYLEKREYTTCLVSSRSYGRLFDSTSIPHFVFDNKIDDESKILLFNEFISEISIKKNPDVIIIGVPGGVIPTNKKITNRFGISAYIISRAITPDISFVSLQKEAFTTEYFAHLNKIMKYRFSAENPYYIVDNVFVDSLSRAIPNQHSLLSTTTNIGGIDIDNIYARMARKENRQQMFDFALQELISNAEFQEM